MEGLSERLTFAAGEVSPALRHRSDLARVQTGLWFLENAVVLPEGGITRRGGTRYLAALSALHTGLLIPFRFGVGNSLMLVIANQTLFVFSGATPIGGVVVAGAIPYLDADLTNVRFVQVGNVVYFACDGYPPQTLTRNGADTAWTFAPYLPTGGPVDNSNLNLNPAITIFWDALTGNVNLTGVGTNWDAGLIGGTFRIALSNLNLIPIWVASSTNIAVNAERQFQGNVYVCTALVGTGNTGATPPTHLDGSVAYDAGGAQQITWKFLYPGYGFIRITGVSSATAATGTAVFPAGSTTWQLPDNQLLGPGGANEPTAHWSPPAWSPDAGWPDRVVLYQSRLMWMRGNTGWITTGGSLLDFDATSPLNAPAIYFRMFADDGAVINAEWAAQNGGVIIVGGHDGEFQVRGGSPFDALTAANVGAFPSDTNRGSCAHIPQHAEGGTLFLGRDRKRLFHLKFSPLAQQSEIPELTRFARHLLDAGAVRIAWANDPFGVIWACLGDGTLVSVTFDRDQRVIGAARHPLLNAFVEDIATVQSVDDTTSQVYLIVRRVVNGATVRYVELLTGYFGIAAEAADARGAWHLDGASQYVGAPATVIAGLGYLQGEQVYAHSDGVMQGPFTVSAGGAITLPQAAANVVVGKLAAWRARSLPFNLATQRGSTKGSRKKANQVVLDMVNAAGGTVTINPHVEGAQSESLELTGAMPYGGPVPLFTGVARYDAGSSTDDMCVVEVGGADTMPFTLTGIAPDLIVEETP